MSIKIQSMQQHLALGQDNFFLIKKSFKVNINSMHMPIPALKLNINFFTWRLMEINYSIIFKLGNVFTILQSCNLQACLFILYIYYLYTVTFIVIVTIIVTITTIIFIHIIIVYTIPINNNINFCLMIILKLISEFINFIYLAARVWNNSS